MNQIQHVLDSADCLYSMTEINAAIEQMASTLTLQYADVNPLLLCVMNGSVITAGHLLPKLPFLLELDYIHASRYGDKTVGGELTWHHKPLTVMQDRDVLLIEDIYDEGITLQTLREYCERAGAKTVKCVTLIEKLHDNKVGTPPEFVGLTVPNRYVFGFGMDYRGYWRNAPGIYAVKDDE